MTDDVEMSDVPSFGELPFAWAFGASTLSLLVFVVDTNVLLDNLPLVQDVLHDATPLHTALIIPWTVIKELEGLIAARKPELQQAAKRATEFLLEHCAFGAVDAISQSRVHFQRLHETHLNLNDAFHSPDDKILDCCQFFYARWRQGSGGILHNALPNLVLLTRDQNLALKAAIHGIGTACDILQTCGVKARTLVERVRGLSLMHCEGSSRNNEEVASRSTTPPFIVEDETSFDAYARVLTRACVAATAAIGAAVEAALAEFLGEDWQMAVRAKPWTLLDVLDILAANCARLWHGAVRESWARPKISFIKKFVRMYGGDVRGAAVRRDKRPNLPELQQFLQALRHIQQALGIDVRFFDDGVCAADAAH